MKKLNRVASLFAVAAVAVATSGASAQAIDNWRATDGTVSLAASVSPDLTKQIQAGKIIQTIAPLVGGKGGGRPEFARGAGKDPSKLPDALREAEAIIQKALP